MQPTIADLSTWPATVALPPAVEVPAPTAADYPAASILGVRVVNTTRRRAIALLEDLLGRVDGRCRSICFVNAHTLNLAADDDGYRTLLNAADFVFGDGTGVRWAARLGGIRLADNVNGTDLVPELLREKAGRGYRYFLLGADPTTIDRASDFARQTFAGWELAGHHHGYLGDHSLCDEAIRQINRARPHLLLVGMGNPLQERWIHEHRDRLRVPVCMAVGGLFHYWSGDLQRASSWLRRFGAEWLGILCQQPHKARRYLLGNPRFLARALWHSWSERRRGGKS